MIIRAHSLVSYRQTPPRVSFTNLMQNPINLPGYAVSVKIRTSPSERAGDKDSGSRVAESGEVWDTRASPHDRTNEASHPTVVPSLGLMTGDISMI
jgi:hypothetical protein